MRSYVRWLKEGVEFLCGYVSGQRVFFLEKIEELLDMLFRLFVIGMRCKFSLELLELGVDRCRVLD